MGRPTIRKTDSLYRLNCSALPSIVLGFGPGKKQALYAELAGIPPETVSCWIHGNRHKNDRGTATTRERAEAFAKVLQIPFDKLWEKERVKL